MLMIKCEWDYVFKNFPHHQKGYVFMTNLKTNISVADCGVEDYKAKGYELGYCKPYIHCRTQKKYKIFVK